MQPESNWEAPRRHPPQVFPPSLKNATTIKDIFRNMSLILMQLLGVGASVINMLFMVLETFSTMFQTSTKLCNNITENSSLGLDDDVCLCISASASTSTSTYTPTSASNSTSAPASASTSTLTSTSLMFLLLLLLLL